ncbi:endospore germination permease [Desulfitobacterium sp. PCE1]|uniref:GerAB/ArcD/ProY family transporter n=1 Tax=Desulfitobacterium sp. PCE1 TaxID=146907 RepID=UPI00037DB6FF|nr:endospore germination permease [Desulfitobacterium sp. PCE1]
MLEPGQITSKQLIRLLVCSRIVIALTYFPVLKEMSPSQDAWLACILYFPLQIIMAAPLYLLAKRFPQQTIIQYIPAIAGKGGKIAGALLLGYFIHQSAMSLALFNLFITGVTMPETPILFFSSSLLLACAYAARQGIEVLGRLSELLLPIILIAITTIILLLTKDMHFKLLQPVLEKGILPVMGGSLFLVSRTYEVIEFAMLLPYLNQPAKTKTVYLTSFFIIAFFLTMISMSIIAILGTGAATRTFPFLYTIRLVSVGNFIERIESIHLAVWILAAFLKMSLQYYIIVLGLSQLFNLKSYKPLILPTGSILVSLSLLVAPSLVELQSFASSMESHLYNIVFVYSLPFLLLLLAVIRKKGVRSP